MEHFMTQKRHHTFRKLLRRHLEKLERVNDAEEQAVLDEVAKIKRSHIRKFGRPKPLSNIPLKGIVSESDKPR
jgi:hypothetical protein